MLPPLHVSAPVYKVDAEGHVLPCLDEIAVEEPLEIRVGHQTEAGYKTSSVSITMRTPGADRELAAGFLFTEGVVGSVADILSVTESPKPGANIVRADLTPSVKFEPETQSRHFYTSSSCGICGKASLAAIALRGMEPIPRESLFLRAAAVHSLPAQLRAAQVTFQATGGLHACALFDSAAVLVDVQEDVGRHNALDKLIGRALLSGSVPLHQCAVLVSGRASFELVQKCVAAGVSVLAAVGAPSSLAIEMAREWDLTLLGFVRESRFNIYSGEWRILHETAYAEELSAATAHPE